VTVVVCSLTKGQEPDEKRQPILWTERPTGAVMGAAGSLWPSIWATMEMSGCNNRQWGCDDGGTVRVLSLPKADVKRR